MIIMKIQFGMMCYCAFHIYDVNEKWQKIQLEMSFPQNKSKKFKSDWMQRRPTADWLMDWLIQINKYSRFECTALIIFIQSIGMTVWHSWMTFDLKPILALIERSSEWENKCNKNVGFFYHSSLESFDFQGKHKITISKRVCPQRNVAVAVVVAAVCLFICCAYLANSVVWVCTHTITI